MALKFNDEVLLKASSAACTAYGALGLAGLDQVHDIYYQNKQPHAEITRGGVGGLLAARPNDEQAGIATAASSAALGGLMLAQRGGDVMAPKFNDDILLQVSAAGTSAWGIVGLAGLDQTHKAFFTDKRQNHPELSRYWGDACAMAGATGFLVARSDDKQLKKDTMKVHGAAWLVCGALSAYNSYKGVQRKELGYADTALGAVMGGLLLTRGFWKDEKDKTPKEKKEKTTTKK
ncbi:hypothetical protein HYH02_011378 [Chlamydomonas schloesseri]|uniref:Uncharacterized protein n=1 Tax=Chlamydomonas schloesseri TaxID=2026947 RepID=A0A835T1A5_9CHLO|nr:hypothetical protein HYH02_011378 [Chlamydomonas schloesseri]|eukprot:KAG2437122.1 hypothetical protein HYH02_011378 [Chlamydomonas schloesseri]